jgi:uncharacterized protein YoaH (UPF0181 family)
VRTGATHAQQVLAEERLQEHGEEGIASTFHRAVSAVRSRARSRLEAMAKSSGVAFK